MVQQHHRVVYSLMMDTEWSWTLRRPPGCPRKTTPAPDAAPDHDGGFAGVADLKAITANPSTVTMIVRPVMSPVPAVPELT
jgi:hypothetical protein